MTNMRNTISVGDLKKLIVEKKDEFKAVIGDGVESRTHEFVARVKGNRRGVS